MATQTLNDLANTLLSNLEQEKMAELSKTASVSHTPVMKTELGVEMLKVAGAIRQMADADITDADIAAFREQYGI